VKGSKYYRAHDIGDFRRNNVSREILYGGMQEHWLWWGFSSRGRQWVAMVNIARLGETRVRERLNKSLNGRSGQKDLV